MQNKKKKTQTSNVPHLKYGSILYSVNKKSVHFLMLNIWKIGTPFFCKFGMVSPKYTIHRSNIKPIPCWAESFTLYGNT